MKKSKSNKEWHVSPSKMPMGDSYGSGIRNPIGRIRDDFGIDTIKVKKLYKPPKSLA